MAGAFDVDDPAVLQQTGNLFVLPPYLTLGVGFEDQRRSGYFGEQLTHRRPAVSASQRCVGMMQPF